MSQDSPNNSRFQAWRSRSVILMLILVVGMIMGSGSFIAARQITLRYYRPVIKSPALDENIATQISVTVVPEVSTATTEPAVTATQESAPVADLPKWDGIGRVTILILGIDYRDWEQNNTNACSDTMILLSLDPLSKKAGILSIPRDLWVEIPSFKNNKINTAHYLGDLYKYPGGGPGLASKTVEQLLGIPVNYYARIDFSAFIHFIDEIGGVKIDVPKKITIDLLGSGASTKKTLQPGVQTLPGSWALAYARARHTEGGDFDRAMRQQQVILAIRDRILSFDLLPQLVQKAPTLFRELSQGINTNLSLGDAIKLAYLAKQVQDQDITQGVINEKYVTFAESADGLDILIPIPDKIRLLRDEVFGEAKAFEPLSTGSDVERMAAEGAKVKIVNGSNQPDLGERTKTYLEKLGMKDIEISDGALTPYTTITDQSGKPYTMSYLVGFLRVSQYRIYSKYDPNTNVDVEITLGTDWGKNNQLP